MTFMHNINPVLVSLGPLEIRYYGLFYAFGFLITYLFLRHAVKQKKIPLCLEELDTFLIYLMMGTVIGARLFEVIFYNPAYYLAHPLKIIAVWEGGLSFHGGLLGIFLAVFLFSKKKNISWLALADLIVIPAALALALGRLGNFMNGELYGRVTSVPWGMQFPGVEGFRHPSQFYESAKNIFIAGILLWQSKKGKQEGYLFGLFLFLYGILRFLVEFVREPQVFVGPLTMGQALSVPVMILGIYLIKKKGTR
ncbi:MAG: prolipoprotein diacylglyceryl transferase [Nanoarchaeota archaeon]